MHIYLIYYNNFTSCLQEAHSIQHHHASSVCACQFNANGITGALQNEGVIYGGGHSVRVTGNKPRTSNKLLLEAARFGRVHAVPEDLCHEASFISVLR